MAKLQLPKTRIEQSFKSCLLLTFPLSKVGRIVKLQPFLNQLLN